MAIEQNEIKKVITVDLGNTATSLKDYKKHIDDLRASLLGLDDASEEYAAIAKEIKTEQDKLNEVMKVGKKNTDAAEGSYDHLVNTMADLKKRWRATADETKRADIGKKINEINGQLKDLDASTGNYQRNVGDYSNKMSGAFKSVMPSVGGLKTGVKGLGGSLKALLANPVVAIVGAIVVVMKKLVDQIKGNEQQMQTLKEAFAVFEPVINAVKNAFTAVAGVLVNTLSKAIQFISDRITGLVKGFRDIAYAFGWDELAQKADGFLQRQQQSIELAKRENELVKDRRANKVAEAKLDAEISELRAKMADREKYSLEDRKKFADEWEAKSKERFELMKKQAQEEYDLINQRNKQTQTGTPDYEAEAEAEANLYRVTQQYNDGLRQLNKTKNSIINGSKDSTKAFNDEAKAVERAVLEMTPVLTPKKAEEAIELTKETIQGEFKTRLKQLNADLKQEGIEFSMIEDTLTTQEKLDRQFELAKSAITQQMSLNLEMLASDAYTEEEKQKLKLETHNLIMQLDKEERLHSKATTEQEKKDREESKKSWLTSFNGISSAAGNLFGALADLSEENSAEQKAFAIMETTINTLQSIMATIAGAADLGPAGWIAAGLQVAANIATGIATINKIKSTTKDSGGSGVSGASAAVQTQSMTSVSPLLNEEADLNRMTTFNQETQPQQNLRVYVVDQDIRDANYKAQVVENNATY